MKKIIRFTISLLFVFSSAYCQKELWGYNVLYNYNNPELPGINDGVIVKTALDGNSQNAEITHTFDITGIQGKFPRGRLFQASNGKLYGVTGYDGYAVGQGIPLGVLFEYDLILDRYKVLSTSLNSASYGVIEPLPGLLYGITNGGSSVFKYNIDTEAFNIVASIPPFLYNNSNFYPKLIGELMKASDGNLYGVTGMAPSSQNVPYPGGIYRLNLTTGQISKLYVFSFTNPGLDVWDPIFNTKLVEGAPGKLYGTAGGGSHIGPQGVAPSGSGTLYEYTIATNSMVKKFDFDYETIGAHPTPIVKSDNKLYGALSGLTNNFNNYPNAEGSVFEYDLDTDALTILHVFDFSTDDSVQYPGGFPLKASDGNLYGTCASGSYKFDPVANTVNRKITTTNANEAKDLIEICRKPSYHFFDNASFAVCQNSPFAFDVQNTNATTYVWKKGSTVLPTQTTAVLNIANLTLADTGIYTCLMTNDCGTTVTMPLQITVDSCLGLDEKAGLKNAIGLYPNPAVNTLNLKFKDSQKFKIQQISISNMLGQMVYESSDKNTAIDIGFLKTGLYQLLLTTDQGDWNGKFIKE